MDTRVNELIKDLLELQKLTFAEFDISDEDQLYEINAYSIQLLNTLSELYNQIPVYKKSIKAYKHQLKLSHQTVTKQLKQDK